MKVKFKNQFFGPNHSRYRKDVVHEVPDAWAKLLPKSAEIVEEAAGTPESKELASIPITPAGKPLAAAKL